MRRSLHRGLAFALLLAAACGGRGGVQPPRPVDRPTADEVVTRVFLIGDAGAPRKDDPVLRALTRHAGMFPATATVVFLGDNVYPRGLPPVGEDGRDEALARLNAQIDAVAGSGASGIFVPGNHDWDRHGAEGKVRVLEAAHWIAAARLRQLPDSACPGPAIEDLPGVRLVFLDTQWWLHGHERGCEGLTPEAPFDALSAAVQPDSRVPVVVAAHHPLASGGTHGGHFPWTAHLFPLTSLKSWAWLPLPILGSVYPIARASGVSDQDLSGTRYRRLREEIAAAMRNRPPLVYAAGHEHNLQVIRGTAARNLLVSGSGYWNHGDYVTWSDSTVYASSESGFMELDVLRTGGVWLRVWVVDRAGDSREAYAQWLQARGVAP